MDINSATIIQSTKGTPARGVAETPIVIISSAMTISAGARVPSCVLTNHGVKIMAARKALKRYIQNLPLTEAVTIQKIE